MAAKADEQFFISMKIDGKDYQIFGDCHLVEMLNSDNQRKRDQAINMIKANCHLDDCSESCRIKPSGCDVNAELELTDQKVWNKKDTQALFNLRQKKDKDFNSNKVHKALWESIAKELAAVGVTATATQCMNKWKALKREYKKTVDHNAQTGSDKKLCPFNEEFGELYGHKRGTRPTYTMSSRMKLNQEKEKVI